MGNSHGIENSPVPVLAEGGSPKDPHQNDATLSRGSAYHLCGFAQMQEKMDCAQLHQGSQVCGCNLEVFITIRTASAVSHPNPRFIFPG